MNFFWHGFHWASDMSVPLHYFAKCFSQIDFAPSSHFSPGCSLQHLVHHRPGGFRPRLALSRGGRCDVYSRLCRLYWRAAWKLLPAQVCTFLPSFGPAASFPHRFLRTPTVLSFQFSVFLGIIFFLELTAGVLAFVFKDWIKDQLNFFINNNIRAYRDDIDLQNLIDFTQEYVSVCF